MWMDATATEGQGFCNSAPNTSSTSSTAAASLLGSIRFGGRWSECALTWGTCWVLRVCADHARSAAGQVLALKTPCARVSATRQPARAQAAAEPLHD